jgi:hypothetical protein
MWVVSFMLWLLYHWGEDAHYPLDRRLVGPQNRSGHGGIEKIFHHHPCQELNRSHPAHNIIFILSELCWAFLISALDGCEWSASCTSHFTLRERAPDNHWTGVWVSSSAGLDAVVNRKSPDPARTWIHYHPAGSPILHHWVILAPTA